ncbi:MAG: ABC transporter permease [Pseudomonadota bacterium]
MSEPVEPMVDQAPLPIDTETKWRRFWRLLKVAPLNVWFSIVVLAFYAVLVVFADFIAPYPETEIVAGSFLPASAEHPMGTDALGRDFLSRMIYAAQNTVLIAIITTLLSFAVGGFLGLLAASVGGWLDQVLGRSVDVLMAIPPLIFALLLLSIFGTSTLNLILIIALVDATRVFRMARAVAMGVVVMEYVEAARLRGEGLLWTVTREVLPNTIAPLMAEFGLRFCFVFLTISALSFLGLGIQPPAADWGTMVRENASLISFGEMTPLYPAAAIGLLTICVNFIVDWLLKISSGLN